MSNIHRNKNIQTQDINNFGIIAKYSNKIKISIFYALNNCIMGNTMKIKGSLFYLIDSRYLFQTVSFLLLFYRKDNYR